MTDAPNFTACTDTDAHNRDQFKLTTLQRAFCDRYIELMGEGKTVGIKKQAALDAGYAPSDAPNAAYKNLRHESCVAYIASQLTAATTKVPVDRSYVLFKALQVVERAEASGQEMAVMRALELIARHVDVAALVGSKLQGDPDANGAGGALSMTFDLAQYTTDEKRLLLDLITRHAPGHAPGRPGGGASPVDRPGRSTDEAGNAQP